MMLALVSRMDKMPALTTHVLDTMKGGPAAGIRIRLLASEGGRSLAEAETDASGRAALAPPNGGPLAEGRYDLVFAVGAYFAGAGAADAQPRFLDEVVIRFGMQAGQAHYHVPLLISPFGYTTYRGQ